MSARDICLRCYGKQCETRDSAKACRAKEGVIKIRYNSLFRTGVEAVSRPVRKELF